jgi:hypothetical protein
MRFDNAFLTVNGTVGMQYKNKNGIIITAYPDKKGNLQVSEGLDDATKSKLIQNYNTHARKYGEVPRGCGL